MTSEADHPTSAYPAGGYQSGRLAADEANGDAAPTDRAASTDRVVAERPVAERPVDGHRATRAGYTAAPPVAADAAVDEAPVVPRGGASATIALVFGMLALVTSISIVGGIVFGLLALIFGVIGSRRAKRGLAYGRGRAIAGILTGLIAIIIAVALGGIALSIYNTSAGKDLRSCARSAGTNVSQLKACWHQYENRATK